MTLLDRPPPTPMPATRIRELYARNPTTETCAMAWEIWRLQRVLIALEAGMRNAASLRHRQDVIDQVTGLLEYIQGEPCLTEPLAVKQGASAASVGKGQACRPPRDAGEKTPLMRGLCLWLGRATRRLLLGSCKA